MWHGLAAIEGSISVPNNEPNNEAISADIGRHVDPHPCAEKASAMYIARPIARPIAKHNNKHRRDPGRSRARRAKTWWVVIAALAAWMPAAQACDGPRLQGSTVRINAQASNIDAEGIVGSTSKSSFFGFGKKKTVQDRPAVVEVGVLSMNCNAALVGSELSINAQANGIRVRGGTVRIGGVVMN